MGPVCIAWMLNKRINVHLNLNVFKRAAFKNVLHIAKIYLLI